MGDKRPYVLEDERDWLLAPFKETDLTLHELLDELAERGVVVACDMLWRFLKREGISFKKTMLAREQDVARHRRWWRRLQPQLAPERLVFIDETWAKTNRTRTHGWLRRGEPLKARVLHGNWRTTVR